MKKQYKSSRIRNYEITQTFFFDRFPLTLSQTTNFRLVQTERVCRQQF